MAIQQECADAMPVETKATGKGTAFPLIQQDRADAIPVERRSHEQEH